MAGVAGPFKRQSLRKLFWRSANHRPPQCGWLTGCQVASKPIPRIVFTQSQRGIIATLSTANQGCFFPSGVSLGVASLYQFDENYHPWHHYAPYYVQDAAYHNGIVWTWLSGAMISTIVTLGQNETTYALLNETASQILHRGAVGTQSELLDAMPRLGQKYPQLSGTQTQAWNLAEFVRNVHEDLAGIQPHLGRWKHNHYTFVGGRTGLD
jgi:hypothetical protein